MSLSDWQLTVGLSVALVLVAVAVVVVIWLARRTSWWPFDPTVRVQVTISLGGLGTLTVRRDREVARLAHQAWVEIVTRKAGQRLDLDHDVIEEVLNSWYELFRELRNVAKSVPGESLRDEDALEMVDILQRALNQGLRPPLTKWQARYRTWWAGARRGHPDDEPQALQLTYPRYAELAAELVSVNDDMVGFAEALATIARGKRR